MIFVTGLQLYLLVYLSFSHMAKSEDTVSTQPTNNVQEEKQKVVKIIHVMEDLAVVFKDKENVEKNLNKISFLSATIGTLLHEGINLDGFNNSETTHNLTIASKDLTGRLYMHIKFQDKKLIKILKKDAYTDEITRTFLQIWDQQKIIVELLKNECNKHDWVEMFEALQYALVLFQNNTESSQVYSLTYLNEAYQGMMKTMFTFSTICDNLINGPQSYEILKNREKKFLQVIQNITKTLEELKVQKQKQYWTKNEIQKLLLQTITSGTNRIVVDHLATNIKIFYDETGYVYHIGISDATKGYNNSVTYCTSECHYIYNYNDQKNIYLMRNKITKNGYRKCGYLDSFNDAGYTSDWCQKLNGNKKIIGDLRDLINGIISNCNILAVSIVKHGFDYGYTTVDDNAFTYRVFNFPCYGKINIAIANYPL